MVLRAFPSSLIGSLGFWSLRCCCWFLPCRRLQFPLFPGSRGCTRGRGAAECPQVDQVIVGTEIGPGLVSAFQEPWDSAGCGPTPWTTAWRTGGRTGAPAAGLVAGAGCLWSSEMPWVPAGWGNNTPSRSWE